VVRAPGRDRDVERHPGHDLGDRHFGEHGDQREHAAQRSRAARGPVDELSTLTRRHGALLAVDEVITFRLAIGGLHTEYGIEPDLVATGKIIGGGFPAGAVGGSASVLASFHPLGTATVSWGGTFSANPVTMAAGATALGKFDGDAIARLNAAGEELRARLQAGGVAVRGSGSLARLISAAPEALWWTLYRRGVLIGTNGLVALSTVMSEQQREEVADAVLDVHRGLPALMGEA
jgi:glutamate-1-semialdehyde 2,1-aminomutase